MEDTILDRDMEMKPNIQKLLELAHYKMPFGKYKGRYLVDLPLAYMVWFRQKGFPKGNLGEHMQTMLDLKSDGLEPIIRRLQQEFPSE
ncbi:MAG: DUF3820 family protein [Bacteroidota bacterium]